MRFLIKIILLMLFGRFKKVTKLFKPYSTSSKSNIINLNKELNINDFELSNYFSHVANINLDDSKSRKTEIKFDKVIDNVLWKQKLEWLYIFTISDSRVINLRSKKRKVEMDKIVKIGGTRNGLLGRTNGYLSGHYTSSSSTNAHIYRIFKNYLNSGNLVKMYAYNIPKTVIKTNVFGNKIDIIPQTFHSYESVALQKYFIQNGAFPCLSSNCDPEYRTTKVKID
jgi:hypothetical protein